MVIPAYNEAGRLPAALPLLIERLVARSGTTELLVVDDGSDDDTARVAEALLADVADGTLLRLGRNEGKGAAIRAGVARASGQRILFMDADLATDLDYVDPVLQALDHAHVALGSRGAPGAKAVDFGSSAWVAHHSFSWLARVATGVPVRDFQCGFKAFRAPAAKLLFHLQEEPGFAFDVELLSRAHRLGFDIVEVPVRWKAMGGSHVRLVRDSVSMAVQLARIAGRARTGRTGRAVASLSTKTRSSGPPPAVTDDLLARMREVLPACSLVASPHGALALLPFLEPAALQRLADQLRADLLLGDGQEIEVEAAMLSLEQLVQSGTLVEPAALGDGVE